MTSPIGTMPPKRTYEMTTIFNRYEIILLTYDQPTANQLVLTGNTTPTARFSHGSV
jgi:hypothetical protein